MCSRGTRVEKGEEFSSAYFLEGRPKLLDSIGENHRSGLSDRRKGLETVQGCGRKQMAAK